MNRWISCRLIRSIRNCHDRSTQPAASSAASLLYAAQARLSSKEGNGNWFQKENWLRKEESQQPSSSSLLCKLTSPLVERMIAHGFPTRLE